MDSLVNPFLIILLQRNQFTTFMSMCWEDAQCHGRLANWLAIARDVLVLSVEQIYLSVLCIPQ